ncbi:hypothetical protein [Aurantimonas endophytica]|uniref:SnoaL-like domain-containing protein n=1 Tax=Aurantimonas endophytica TaxID=1522175 RepID=A0A7W6HI10_9HYPH|nr:hypothetical protein [Aurantimonas endophytica]MBB4005543.1 hypothetical protein [Aurantimonas endophytica]MCO6406485.1 hypothetical protein [Aurantimonas endophytica]
MNLRRVLALSVLAWTSTQYAAEASPEAVVRELSVALLSRDADRILAIFDREHGGYAYTLRGDLTTGPAFEAWLRRDIIARGRVFVIDRLQVVGNRVEVEATYGIGKPSIFRRYIFEVVDGKVAGWFIGY